MILANITFGKAGRHKHADLEDIALTYLARVLHNGQICGEYFYAWTKGMLNAYVHLASPTALAAKYHSKWGLEQLNKVICAFRSKPRWVILEEEKSPHRSMDWRGVPFLYLSTDAFDSAPPVLRGDDGTPVPSYLLPLSYEDREQLYFWQCNYAYHDHIWLGSGTLEVPAYRELADPASELSQHGRDLCRAVQRTTGVATYYYVMRYWARSEKEDARGCPGCGRPWRTKWPGSDQLPFWCFHFQCERCRLVSHLGVSTDGGRHARIGEYQKAKKGREQTAAPNAAPPHR